MGGLLGRLLASLLLVLVTYNPSGLCFVGDLALIGCARRLLGFGFFGAVVWMVSSWGWFASPSHAALIWLVLVVVACMLTIGLCWGLIRARVSGQAVVEEVQR
jgi:hypothetical protein